MTQRVTTKEPIRCRVVEILSDRDLVLDAGERKGVSTGMVFEIKGEAQIKDPDTKDLLEIVEFEKIRVRVSFVGDEVSVAGIFSGSGEEDRDYLRRPWFISQERRGGPDWDRSVEVKDMAVEVMAKA